MNSDGDVIKLRRYSIKLQRRLSDPIIRIDELYDPGMTWQTLAATLLVSTVICAGLTGLILTVKLPFV